MTIMIINASMPNETHEDDTDESHHHIIEAQISAIILSIGLGLIAAVLNGLLLLTLYKDPLKCFRRRPSTLFIQGLAACDFLTGIFIQQFYAISLLFEVTKGKVKILHDIALIGSHIGTKISILTLVVLSVDRLLAIALPWKYSTIITRKRAVLVNFAIWIFVLFFELSHFISSIEEVLHDIDVHLQTTVPITGLVIIFAATYLSFRKHSRSIAVVPIGNQPNQLRVRNLHFEKKILFTVLLIMLVVLVSLSPYLIVHHLGENCFYGHNTHDEVHDDEHEERHQCKESEKSAVLRFLCISFLCVAPVVNPVLYGWRIPHYRQSLKNVARSTFKMRLDQVTIELPSNLNLTEGNTQD